MCRHSFHEERCRSRDPTECLKHRPSRRGGRQPVRGQPLRRSTCDTRHGFERSRSGSSTFRFPRRRPSATTSSRATSRTRRPSERSNRTLSAPPAGAVLDELARKLILSRMRAGSGSRCRDLLERYYLNGETTSSIAETMRSTPATVLVFLHKCRKRALAAYRALTERGGPWTTSRKTNSPSSPSARRRFLPNGGK